MHISPSGTVITAIVISLSVAHTASTVTTQVYCDVCGKWVIG